MYQTMHEIWKKRSNYRIKSTNADVHALGTCLGETCLQIEIRPDSDCLAGPFWRDNFSNVFVRYFKGYEYHPPMEPPKKLRPS